MIVRIIGEGQFAVEDNLATRLNELDTELLGALDGAREDAFTDVLARMLELVRAEGRALPVDEFVESDAILPPAGASLVDVRALIGDMGLIPD